MNFNSVSGFTRHLFPWSGLTGTNMWVLLRGFWRFVARVYSGPQCQVSSCSRTYEHVLWAFQKQDLLLVHVFFVIKKTTNKPFFYFSNISRHAPIGKKCARCCFCLGLNKTLIVDSLLCIILLANQQQDTTSQTHNILGIT